MAKYDISESIEGCFDISVEVDFFRPLEMKETIECLQFMSDLLAKGQKSNHFEGIVSTQISLAKIYLQLRYFTKQKLDSLGIKDTEYEEPLGLAYIFYLFANINKRFPIGKHPFYVNLQDYEEYPW